MIELPLGTPRADDLLPPMLKIPGEPQYRSTETGRISLQTHQCTRNA